MPSQSAQLNVLRNSMSNHVTLLLFLQKYSDVFSEKGAKRQPFLRDAEYKIKLLPVIKPPYGLIYPLSAELSDFLGRNI